MKKEAELTLKDKIDKAVKQFALSMVKRFGFYLTVSVAFMFVMILGFTFFYMKVENLNFLDAFYFTIITTRTIGFGDISPGSTEGKLGTIVNALLPSAVFMGASLLILESTFKKLEIIWKRKLMKRHKNHTIIIANKDLIASIAAEYLAEKEDFVVIHPSAMDQLPARIQKVVSDENYLNASANNNDSLLQVNIEQANRIIIATSDDVLNLFVLVAAKDLNKNIKSIIRVNHEENESKVRAVGGDLIIPTYKILGSIISQAAVHSVAHEFVIDMNTRTKDPFLEERKIKAKDVDKNVRDVYPTSIAVYRADDYICLLDNFQLKDGDIVLVLNSKIS
ncbi:MAG: NAD-binding protein [Lentisphaeria bacterium]|nr:ion channel [Lentisphaeria bacterium]NQZ69497.1 NAD-binding protein [Lentisphaeria bacterium]